MKIIGNTFGWTIFNHSLLLTAFVFCKFVFVYQIYDLGVASSFLLQQITFPLLTIVVTVLGFIGIKDVDFIYAEGMGMGPEAQAKGIEQAKEQLETLAY